MNFLILYSLIALSLALPLPDNKDSAVVFAGTTPCSNIIRPLHQIKSEPDCKLTECLCFMVEWQLTLYRNPVTNEPTSYKLTGINLFTVKETNTYSQPGTKTKSTGKWAITKGIKTNSAAVVYKLNPDKPAKALSLVKLNDDLLHIVDGEGKLLIGNEFYSYTLNRLPTTNK